MNAPAITVERVADALERAGLELVGLDAFPGLEDVV